MEKIVVHHNGNKLTRDEPLQPIYGIQDIEPV